MMILKGLSIYVSVAVLIVWSLYAIDSVNEKKRRAYVERVINQCESLSINVDDRNRRHFFAYKNQMYTKVKEHVKDECLKLEMMR